MSSLNVVNLFQHITASISGGIYARVWCILYCVYDVVVRKTTESERHANPNPKSYLVAVQYGGLPRLKDSSRSLCHLLMSFLF